MVDPINKLTKRIQRENEKIQKKIQKLRSDAKNGRSLTVEQQ